MKTPKPSRRKKGAVGSTKKVVHHHARKVAHRAAQPAKARVRKPKAG